MKLEIPEQYKDLFLSLHSEAETSKIAYCAGWDACLVATAKKLRSLDPKEPI